MSTKMIPFNLSLLQLTAEQLKLLGRIKVLDTYMPSSRQFHPEGLFSTEIFGRVGLESRNTTFGYIHLNTVILHPLMYEVLDNLKGLYTQIMQSKAYAVWDANLSDFVKSDPVKGRTGYAFFMSHFNELQFEKNQSDKRTFNIALMDKYRKKAMLTDVLVMPAGLRDHEIDATGKPSEDEINGIYRKILSLSSLLNNQNKLAVDPSFDGLRASLQASVYELFDYIRSILEGKHKMILGRWGSRRIQNGTRNVITTVNHETKELQSEVTIGANDTVVGLYQFMKATQPKMVHALRSGLLSQVFTGPGTTVKLVGGDYRAERLELSGTEYDTWMTTEGIETQINQYGEEGRRHLPVTLRDNYYLALVYDDGKTVMILQDIDNLPDNLNKKNVRPITYTELFYFSANTYYREVSGFFTRYPITGYGSIYPCNIYLRTTVPSKQVTMMPFAGLWEEMRLTQYPILGADFMNSMAPSNTHLARLGADFDGDTCSLNIVYTDEAVSEIKNLLTQRRYYVDVNNHMNFSADNDALSVTLANMTG